MNYTVPVGRYLELSERYQKLLEHAEAMAEAIRPFSEVAVNRRMPYMTKPGEASRKLEETVPHRVWGLAMSRRLK